MTRSRRVVLVAGVVVALGLAAGLGAFLLDPARAAVGPVPAQALVLPADARFVLGFDVKRFVASPFYERYGKLAQGQPQALRELEEKLGLDPRRDLDLVVVAGAGGGQPAGAAVVLGRFDRYTLARAIETEKKATWKDVQGTTLYLFQEGDKAATGLAFLDETALVVGSAAAVEAAVVNRAQGLAPLRSNAALVALLEKVTLGATFWMVGDQSLLANLPQTLPAPGGGGGSLNLPPLRSLIVAGDLDPDVSLQIIGTAADEAAARNLADVVRGLVALAALQAAQKPELKQLTSAINVTTDQASVLVSARVPYALLDSLGIPGGGTPAPGGSVPGTR
jgi:hypothetical protein